MEALHKDGTPAPGTADHRRHARARDEGEPQHPGANHYYIHAVEASKTPERAVPQAGRLETLVPGAGHLVHMPAHIYIRTGQYAKSAKSNADAAAVDEKYFKATGAERPFYATMYYGHNLQFESAAAMFSGNLAQAHAAAQRTVALADPIADQMLMIEPFAAQELAVVVRFGSGARSRREGAGAIASDANLAVSLREGRGAGRHGQDCGSRSRARGAEAASAKIPEDAMVGAANRPRMCSRLPSPT